MKGHQKYLQTKKLYRAGTDPPRPACIIPIKIILSTTLIRQTKYVVMMTKEGSSNIANFMTPGAGVLVLGCGHISHIAKIHLYFFKMFLSKNKT